MRIQIWINPSYIITQVAYLLRQQGLIVETVADDYIVGEITDTQPIWKVKAVEVYTQINGEPTKAKRSLKCTAWQWKLLKTNQ